MIAWLRSKGVKGYITQIEVLPDGGARLACFPFLMPRDFAFSLEVEAHFPAPVSGLTTYGHRNYRRLLVDGTEPLGVHPANPPLNSLLTDGLLGGGQGIGGRAGLTIDGPSTARECR